MSGKEPEQSCPFCNAAWGSCQHFQILADWEAEALVSQANRSRYVAKDAGTTPPEPQPLAERLPTAIR